MRFRTKLLVGMMLLVVTLTASGFFLAQRKALSEAELDMQNDFRSEVSNLRRIQEIRNAALAELCGPLVLRPRIHAALEDNALDVLYLTARDEMQEVMRQRSGLGTASGSSILTAKFYRFLDSSGDVISPPDSSAAGQLSHAEEAELSLHRLPDKQQLGYIVTQARDGRPTIDEVIAIPIISTETGEVIAALVLGFDPTTMDSSSTSETTRSGIFVFNHVAMPGLAPAAITRLTGDLTRAIASHAEEGTNLPVQIAGDPYLLFYKRINPDSLFTPAYEVVIYPLTQTLAKEHQLWWQIIAAEALLLFAGMLASHFLAARLSSPVEKLEVDSLEDKAQRQRAEAALQMRSAELQRAARFSADASHQLKTPLTVLRAGLDNLLAQTDLHSDVREEVAALVHQTFRLTSIIEDLLLLSRMEAGRLRIDFASVNLIEVIEGLIDDLTALPSALTVHVDQDSPALLIAGEKRYISLILQNLLENAWKYNCTGGEIRIRCRHDGQWATVVIANTGISIPPEARERIFERFHRATIGENIPGHGLGLNLARELARLHGGDLRLTRSDEEWTEFEVRFRLYLSGAAHHAPDQRITARS
jgi:signal transduction histidine kinase